jgi:acyl-CoA dehydrogenase
MTSASLDFDGLRPPSAFMGEHHQQWRQQVRDFVDEVIAPNIDDWDASGTFPDDVYKSAVKAGVFGFGFPESLGGTGVDTDLYTRAIFAEELHRFGTGVVFADLATHWIGLPPVIEFGDDALREQVGRSVLAGEKRISFAVTEPGGGSDVSRISTVAAKSNDGWIVNGSKTLISGGLRADYVLTAVRTGGDGMRGISLLLIDADDTGVSRSPVPGFSWYNASLASIEFQDVAVPAGRLIGQENAGFAALTRQFNTERVSGIAAALALCRVCLSQAFEFARERETFGKRLIDHQVIRHKLVDMLREVRGTYAYLDSCIWQFENAEVPVADLCMLKVQASTVLERCSRECLHIVGGSAYNGKSRLERIFRESRIFALGGGTEEILKDLAGRQLRF